MAQLQPEELAQYTDLAVRSLGRYGSLSEGERESIARSVESASLSRAESELIAEGQPLQSHLLLSGWAARVRFLSDGRRQILSFVVAGDTFGLCARPSGFALSRTIALTPVVFAPMACMQEALLDGDGRYDGLSEAAWNTLSLEESLLVNHLVRLGQQTAYERVAHLFLELYHRLRVVELARETSFRLPLTQEILADALGLSVVHTNRTLQQLRRDGFLDYRGGTVTLQQENALAKRVDFRVPPRLQQAERVLLSETE